MAFTTSGQETKWVLFLQPWSPPEALVYSLHAPRWMMCTGLLWVTSSLTTLAPSDVTRAVSSCPSFQSVYQSIASTWRSLTIQQTSA